MVIGFFYDLFALDIQSVLKNVPAAPTWIDDDLEF